MDGSLSTRGSRTADGIEAIGGAPGQLHVVRTKVVHVGVVFLRVCAKREDEYEQREQSTIELRAQAPQRFLRLLF